MKKPSILFRCVYTLIKAAFYIFYNIKVEGLENIPKDKPCVIASNHRTNADPPLIAITSGCCRFAFVAKEELFRFPPFGWLISKLGAFPVTRGKGDFGVIDTAVSKIRDDRRLVIFPEGTRSKTGKVGKGKTGVALIAARSGAPVVPAGIIFDGKLKFRTKITVKFGKPISPEELKISSDSASHELKGIKRLIMESIVNLVEGDSNGGN